MLQGGYTQVDLNTDHIEGQVNVDLNRHVARWVYVDLVECKPEYSQACCGVVVEVVEDVLGQRLQVVVQVPTL